MKKFILAIVCVVALSFTANAFCYDFDDPVPDRIGSREFELFGANVNQAGNMLNMDIFSNYPSSGLTVGGWNTFAGDLAFDVDRNGVYEYGVAFTNHDGFTAGSVYSVNSWKISDDYEPAGGGYGYNHNKIVAIESGSLLGSGSLIWNTLGGLNPDFKVSLSFNTNLITLPPNHDGYVDFFYAVATCANDFMSGTIHVVPEPISAVLFLFGGGALAIRQYRKKKQIG